MPHTRPRTLPTVRWKDDLADGLGSTMAVVDSTGMVVNGYTYDPSSGRTDRLTGISHVKDGSTTVASVAYALDDVGNRTQRVDQQGTHTYAYDDLYRLTSVTYPDPSTTGYAIADIVNWLAHPETVQ